MKTSQTLKILKLSSPLIRLVYNILARIFPSYRALKMYHEVEKLEKNKNYERASQFRHNAISSIDRKYTAPFWRQEGFDYLYRLRDYSKSLAAFENAIEVLELSPMFYGVSNPLDIYFGAATASVAMGLQQKGQKYFMEFKKRFNILSKEAGLQKHLQSYNEGIQWIEEGLLQLSNDKK